MSTSGDNFFDWAGKRIVKYSEEGMRKTLEQYNELGAEGLNIPSWCVVDGVQLQALNQFVGLRVLILQNQTTEDLNFLGSLPQLEELSLARVGVSLDLARFGNLKKLSVEWRDGLFINSGLSGVRSLSIWGYKSRSGGLLHLRGFPLLTQLKLIQSSITDLTDISCFDALESIELHYMSRLCALPKMNLRALTSFAAEDCKKLTEVGELSACLNLVRISLHRCGPLASLAFINGLQNLREFRFIGTNILDGDLSPLMRLNEVAFTQKKHFSHKLKDFGARTGVIL